MAAFHKENVGIFARALIAAGATFVVQAIVVLAVLFIDESLADSLWFDMTLELLSAALGIIFFLHLGGKDFFFTKPSVQADTFRFGWWSLALTTGLGALAFYEYLEDGTPLSETWPVDFVTVALLCLAIGLFEEIVFRGLLLNGLLSVFGGTKRGVVVCTIVVSAVFGLAHVDTDSDFATPMMATQAVLKAVQTGAWGFMLAVCVLKHHDITGPALFHGFEDFLPSIGSALFSEPFDTDYVTDDEEDGLFTILFYAVVIILYLPFIIKSVRWLMQEGGPDLGAFSKVPAIEPVPMAELPEPSVTYTEYPTLAYVKEPAQQSTGETPPLPTGWH